MLCAAVGGIAIHGVIGGKRDQARPRIAFRGYTMNTRPGDGRCISIVHRLLCAPMYGCVSRESGFRALVTAPAGGVLDVHRAPESEIEGTPISGTHEVRGSSPLSSTNFFNGHNTLRARPRWSRPNRFGAVPSRFREPRTLLGPNGLLLGCSAFSRRSWVEGT